MDTVFRRLIDTCHMHASGIATCRNRNVLSFGKARPVMGNAGLRIIDAQIVLSLICPAAHELGFGTTYTTLSERDIESLMVRCPLCTEADWSHWGSWGREWLRDIPMVVVRDINKVLLTPPGTPSVMQHGAKSFIYEHFIVPVVKPAGNNMFMLAMTSACAIAKFPDVVFASGTAQYCAVRFERIKASRGDMPECGICGREPELVIWGNMDELFERVSHAVTRPGLHLAHGFDDWFESCLVYSSVVSL